MKLFPGFCSFDPAEQKRHEVEFYKQEKDRALREAASEIGTILGKLNKCLIRPGLGSRRLEWPEEIALARLSELVAKIHRLHGCRGNGYGHWENYQQVDRLLRRRFATQLLGLRLCKTVERLCKRVAEHVPERPLERLTQAAKAGAPHTELARNLIEIWSNAIRGFLDFGAEDLTRFDLLFRTPGSPVIENQATRQRSALPPSQRKTLDKILPLTASRAVNCYVVFLEWLWEDAQWSKRHAKGADAILDWGVEIFPKGDANFRNLERLRVGNPEWWSDFDNHPDRFKQHEKEQLAASNREAVRRFRAKKIEQQSITSTPIVSTESNLALGQTRKKAITRRSGPQT